MLHRLLLTALLLTAPSAALACLNAVKISTDKATDLAVRAEKALDEGDYRGAFNILNAVGDIQEVMDDDRVESMVDGEVVFKVKDRALRSRLYRMYAVALLRTRPNKIMSILEILDREIADAPKDPYLQARLAEALVAARKVIPKIEVPEGLSMTASIKESVDKLRQRTKEARGILESLAKKDLVPDADAYALLGKLRKEAKDSAGAQAALERCHQMARRPAEQCDGAPAAPTAGAAPAAPAPRPPSQLRSAP